MSGQHSERHKALLKDGTVGRPSPKVKKISPRELVQSLKAINAPTHTEGKRPASLKHRKHVQGDQVIDVGRGTPFPLVDPLAWPFQCVGKVIVGSGLAENMEGVEGFPRAGTGVMVGSRVMLTASHIMPSNIDEHVEPWWISFQPGLDDYFDDGIPVAKSFVQQYYSLDDSFLESGGPSGNDVVVCILESPLGDTFGWWGSESYGYAVDYPPWATSVGYLEDPRENLPLDAVNALTLVSHNVTFNEIQIEREAVDDNEISVDVPSLPAPVDTADFRNWRLRTDLYAGKAWVGGPLWIDAVGTSQDPEAGGRDGSTDASISAFNSSDITSPRVIGVVGQNTMGETPYTYHAGGVLMVLMIQHANQLFP